MHPESDRSPAQFYISRLSPFLRYLTSNLFERLWQILLGTYPYIVEISLKVVNAEINFLFGLQFARKKYRSVLKISAALSNYENTSPHW